jgi:hypothetical protein
VPVVHLDDGLAGLLHPVQDLLVLDLEPGRVLSFLAYFLPVRVVFTGVRRHVGQDGQLVDVRVILRIGSLEFRMQGLVAGAGQAGIALVDLDVGISLAEGKATYLHISDIFYLYVL